jgi:hypothetical protein
MGSSQSALKKAVPAVLALILLEAIVSIVARWPHQFGGAGRRDEVLSNVLGSGGTALAPPLWLVVLLALTGAGLYARGAVPVVATVVLIPVAVILTVGVAGELLAPASADVPRAVQLIAGVVDGACCLTLLVLAVSSLVATWRSRAVAHTV